MHLHFREYGNSGQQPLVIFHGLFGSSDNWLTQAKLLSPDYHVYLVDQRNHGLSPKSEEFTYALLAEDIHDFITEHAIKNPVLIGHSMGGKAVMEFALKYPKLVEKIVVVDIAPKAYPIQHDTILEGLKKIPINSLTSRNEADEILSDYVPEAGIRQFLLKNLQRTDDDKFVWKINLPVLDEKIGIISQGIDANGTFEKPVLFINGAHSGYIKDADKPLIKELFPHHYFVTLDSGHWVQAEKPQEFVETLKAFLTH